MNPKAIIIHCSASPDNPTRNDTETIRKYHKKKGWSDIGYHYLVEMVNGTWQVIKGRPDNVPGAHCRDGGMNSKSLGICLVGGDPYKGFSSKYPLPEGQWNKAVSLVSDLCRQYNISTMDIHPHNHFNKRKTCPGINFNITKFRQDVLKERKKNVNKYIDPELNSDEQLESISKNIDDNFSEVFEKLRKLENRLEDVIDELDLDI